MNIDTYNNLMDPKSSMLNRKANQNASCMNPFVKQSKQQNYSDGT